MRTPPTEFLMRTLRTRLQLLVLCAVTVHAWTACAPFGLPVGPDVDAAQEASLLGDEGAAVDTELGPALPDAKVEVIAKNEIPIPVYAPPKLQMSVKLPAATTVLVDGSHRVVLAAKGLAVGGCLTADCSAEPCPAGQVPWKAALATPSPQHIALSVKGTIVFASGIAGGSIGPDGKLGTLVSAGGMLPSVQLVEPFYTYSLGAGYTSLFGTKTRGLASASGSVLIFHFFHGEYDKLGFGTCCMQYVTTEYWLRLPVLGGPPKVLVEDVQKEDYAYSSYTAIMLSVHQARALPEGGVVAVTCSAAYKQAQSKFVSCKTIVAHDEGLSQGPAYPYDPHPSYFDKAMLLSVADRLGSLWLFLGTPSKPPTEGLATPILVESPSADAKLPLPALESASHIIATTDGSIVVLGTPLAAAPTGTTALEFVRLALSNYEVSWRTTVVLPFAVQPFLLERLPGGGVLLAATRHSDDANALWLAWFDASGALVRERLVPVSNGQTKPLIAVNLLGQVAVGLPAAGIMRFATLQADGAWTCKPATSACASCDDGNPCTKDSCANSACSLKDAGCEVCVGCKDDPKPIEKCKGSAQPPVPSQIFRKCAGLYCVETKKHVCP